MTLVELAKELGTEGWVLAEFAPDIVTRDQVRETLRGGGDIELDEEEVTAIQDAWSWVPKPTSATPMSEEELRYWLELHGVSKDKLDQYTKEYTGKTLDEMNAISDELHGDMA